MASKLETAAKLVKEEKYGEAAREYQVALRSRELSEKERLTAFQNCGACLRRTGKNQQAIKILKEGLREYTNAPTLHQNIGTCYREQSNIPGNKWKALGHFLNAKKFGNESAQLIHALVGTLNDLAYSGLAYNIFRDWFKGEGAQAEMDTAMISTLLELMGTVLDPEEAKTVGEWCLDSLGDIAGETIAGQTVLAIYKAKMGQTEQAKIWFERAKKGLIQAKQPTEQEEQAFINAGWNLSIALLKSGEMQEGWQLYDYGLQAPAPGPQRWQRSLSKPLHATQLPPWQGETLSQSRILVLAEQAVGDTIMFLQLLPELHKRCPQVTVIVQPRLVPIYKRIYPELTILNEKEDSQSLRADQYDFQIPCGSLPQHLLNDWIKSGWKQTIAKTDRKLSTRLRKRYRKGMDNESLLIGVSWLGGGKSERIRTKSLPPDLFATLFKANPGCRFLSIQYGNVQGQVEVWRASGVDIIHDDSIDPMKNMDDWMAQVACCDAVISVANTTIHGAGLLGIPTLCLRSRNSDWRWIRGLDKSYWYKSVEAVTQSPDGDWLPCIEWAKRWMEERKGSAKELDAPTSETTTNEQEIILKTMRF